MGTLKGNNLSKVKKQNVSMIREVIYKYAPISRSGIAEMLALTPPTITTNIAAMIEQGLVCECAASDGREAEHGLGRRPVKINFLADAVFFAGVEINSYQIAICIVNLRGEIKARARIPRGKAEVDGSYSDCLKSLCRRIGEGDYRQSLELLAGAVLETISQSGVDKEKILGVGVGAPGFVDHKNGILRKSPLREWNDQTITGDLSRLLDLPVVLENNARARAVGQELFSRDIRPDTFAYYLISYGIACPLYIKNSVLDGEQQGAGEAGHMVAVLNGPRCETCGNDGCLEEVASERAIVKTMKQEIGKGRSSLVTEACPDLEALGCREILMAQEAGDELAEEVMGQAIMYLGASLANIINLINPPLVFVDSYLMKLEKNRIRLVEETRKHIFGLYDEEVEIEFIDFDHFTGAKGAAALAIKKYFIYS